MSRTVESPDALIEVIGELAQAGRCQWLLLDIGGVLCPDPWESLISTPGIGLAARLGAPDLPAMARDLWPKYATKESDAASYWRELSDLSGVELDATAVLADAPGLLAPYPWAHELLTQPPCRIALISDNTTFWFGAQSAELKIGQSKVERTYLSFERGVRKRDEPVGLFDIAAGELAPETSVVVDDRAPNVLRAAKLGFEALHFKFE